MRIFLSLEKSGWKTTKQKLSFYTTMPPKKQKRQPPQKILLLILTILITIGVIVLIGFAFTKQWYSWYGDTECCEEYLFRIRVQQVNSLGDCEGGDWTYFDDQSNLKAVYVIMAIMVILAVIIQVLILAIEIIFLLLACGVGKDHPATQTPSFKSKKKLLKIWKFRFGFIIMAHIVLTLIIFMGSHREAESADFGHDYTDSDTYGTYEIGIFFLMLAGALTLVQCTFLALFKFGVFTGSEDQSVLSPLLA